jgi:plasmid stabilization system protein ParE
MSWNFHPEALEEYEAAASYYAERDPELQLRFIESIENSIDRILEAPTRWRVIDEDVRRCVTHVFPYGILYTIETDFILVIAVMHFSREPGYWKQRIEIS